MTSAESSKTCCHKNHHEKMDRVLYFLTTMGECTKGIEGQPTLVPIIYQGVESIPPQERTGSFHLAGSSINAKEIIQVSDS